MTKATKGAGAGSPPTAASDPDVSNEEWAKEIARREAELRPTESEFGPCTAPMPAAPVNAFGKRPAAPRRGVVVNKDKIDARKAINMGRRSAGGTDMDGAALLLKAVADPASGVRIELPGGTTLENAKPNMVKGVFVTEDGAEHQFEDCRISFWKWAKWLPENGYKGFPSGTAAWRDSVSADPTPVPPNQVITDRIATPNAKRAPFNPYLYPHRGKALRYYRTTSCRSAAERRKWQIFQMPVAKAGVCCTCVPRGFPQLRRTDG